MRGGYRERSLCWSRRCAAFGAWLAVVLGGTACHVIEGPGDENIFDVPLSGLTPAQNELHLKGDEEFGRVFTPADGLGPIYNAASCDTCHPGEAKGHPTFNLTRFGRHDGDRFWPMVDQGGPQLQDRAVPGYPAERIPDEASGVTELTAPAITGLGFVEAVTDETLLEMADPEDEDGDGISGRVQLIEETESLAEIVTVSRLAGETQSGRLTPQKGGTYIGRFGWKAKAVNLRHQTVGAYADDMGITTRFNPEDLGNVQAVGEAAQDGATDPEVPVSTVNNVVFYLKTLRPPARRDAEAPDVKAGEAVFAEIGCADCHVPTLKTGESAIEQLSNKEFHPYSDFLLHDMGSRLDDGYTEGRAETGEWRTPPLWGLGLADDFQGGTPRLLHDGRASSIREAIGFHGGEAEASREAFEALSDARQRQLMAFLDSL